MDTLTQCERALLQRFHTDEDDESHQSNRDRRSGEAEPYRRPDRGQQPDDRCRGDTHQQPLTRQDDTCAKEADPRDDLTKDPGRVGSGSSECGSQQHKKMRPQADQDARPDPRWLTAKLPLEPDHATAHDTGEYRHPERECKRVEAFEGRHFWLNVPETVEPRGRDRRPVGASTAKPADYDSAFSFASAL